MAYEYTDRFFDLFHDRNVSRNRVTFALKAFRLIRNGAAIYVDLFRPIARSKQTRKAEIRLLENKNSRGYYILSHLQESSMYLIIVSCRVKTRSMSKYVRRCENDARKASIFDVELRESYYQEKKKQNTRSSLASKRYRIEANF